MTAAKIWPGHPDVELSLGMTAIGEAARERKPVGDAVFKTIDDAASKAPLAPEPFLVRGVQAQLARNAAQARQAFLAAEWRDPRSMPARYFLATDYFATGDVQRGLQEFAVLARLAPGGVASVAPYIAAYAKDRANWPHLRSLFRAEPELEQPALLALAADPANARAILALADPRRRSARSLWLPNLLAGLVQAGQFAQARAVWSEVAGIRLDQQQLIYDPQFADPNAPPPFNWELTSSTVGLAERQAGGRLHVIYYGQEEGDLARQVLLLTPGTYQLAMRVSGNPGRSLSWSLACAKPSKPLATFRLDPAALLTWAFSVPADCPAQVLALVGASSDIAQQSDTTISELRLRRQGAND